MSVHGHRRVVGHRISDSARSLIEPLESRLLFAGIIKITVVKDIVKGAESGFVGNPVVLNEELFFTANTSAGLEVWSSDGTRKGTDLLRDINGAGSSNPNSLTAAKGRFYFRANDGESGEEPWVSTGSRGGTQLLSDVEPGPDGSGPVEFVTTGRHAMFAATQNGVGRLLVSSGNTFTRADLPKSEGIGNPLAGMDGRFYFSFNSGKDNTDPTDDNTELWSIAVDGSDASIVKDVADGFSAFPQNPLVVGDTLYFTAYSGTKKNNARMLFKTDGTTAGTRRLADLNLEGAADLDRIVRVGDDVFFSIHFSNGDQQLWTSTGTKKGTELIATINDSDHFGEISHIQNVKGKVFFNARTTEHGDELWVTDGTFEGTEMLEDLNPGDDGLGRANSSSPRDFVQVGKWLYFTATTAEHGQELWRTDGTKTRVLTDKLNPGPTGSSVFHLAKVEKTLFFSATTPEQGRELFTLSIEPEAAEQAASTAPPAVPSRVQITTRLADLFGAADDDGDDDDRDAPSVVDNLGEILA